ncbi:unnamed protein product, partial [marine sediment metagenome]
DYNDEHNRYISKSRCRNRRQNKGYYTADYL